MPKPIFIITINWPSDNFEGISRFQQDIQLKLHDYHVLVSCDGSITETKYQLFSDKEIEPIELEKLKEILNVKQ